jgi:hypothetical protein
MSLLAAASSNASEIIGVSLLGAIDSLTGSDGIANVSTDIENAAKSLANFIDSVVYLKEQIASIPGAGIVKGAFGLIGNVLGRFSPQRAEELLKEIQGVKEVRTGYGQQSPGDRKAAEAANALAVKRNKELAALAKSQAKSAADILKKKKEAAALDKATAAAQLALGKGADVFDMDKIQINAALIGQAEALGKAESAAQVLSIANDIQRLKVKQSINELEDAIASKDVARIERATKQLNEDLKILGTLQSQNFTLLGIKTVLDNLKPKELIDQENLNMALDKIREMLRLLAQAGATPSTRAKSGIPKGDYVPPVVFDPNTSIDAVIEYADAATERATAFAILQEQENYAAYLSLIEFQKKLGDFGGYSADMNRGAGYGSGSTVTVEIVDKTSGLIEVVQTAVQENNRFGNNLNFAGAI